MRTGDVGTLCEELGSRLYWEDGDGSHRKGEIDKTVYRGGGRQGRGEEEELGEPVSAS